MNVDPDGRCGPVCAALIRAGIGAAAGLAYEWWTNGECAEFDDYARSAMMWGGFNAFGGYFISAGFQATAAGLGLAARGVAADFTGAFTGGIGRSGAVGENFLASRLGGMSQQGFATPFGRRVIDQIAQGVGLESKVGYQALTNRIQQQIVKDGWLTATGRLSGGVEWHFFASPVTGVGGPSGPLFNALLTAGIRVVLH
jgi:hypothetical protein